MVRRVRLRLRHLRDVGQLVHANLRNLPGDGYEFKRACAER